MKRTLTGILTVAVVLMFAGAASAGFYKTITIDGDFSDWAEVPVLDSDAADNAGGVDLADMQIANDDAFLYIRMTYHTALTLNTFIALDIDANVATGFDIFSLGQIGSEAGWQNDFGFAQDTGAFNTGALGAGVWGVGAAPFSPAGDNGDREYMIQLDTVFATGGAPVFPDDAFTVQLWTDSYSQSDVSSAVPYTLAIPEPATAGLLLLGGLAMVLRRRR